MAQWYRVQCKLWGTAQWYWVQCMAQWYWVRYIVEWYWVQYTQGARDNNSGLLAPCNYRGSLHAAGSQ